MFGLIPSILSNIPSRSSSLILKENSRTLEQYIMCLLSRGSIHQGHEGFSGQSRGKQCSFMSLSALLTAQTIPVIEWNSTTIDNVLVQGDNMYLNAFNNDLIPREGFLSLNNLPTVVGVVCCRQIYTPFALH